jgi:CrcB protein
MRAADTAAAENRQTFEMSAELSAMIIAGGAGVITSLAGGSTVPRRLRAAKLSPPAPARYSGGMESLRPFVIVFIGAGLGGALRHGLNVGVTRALGTGFPWATFLINITGSVAMGLLVGALAFRASASWTQSARLFVATGVLGGYTTFSTISLETILLIERNQFGAALAYVGGSVLLGVGGLWAGLSLMRSLA